MPARAYTLNSIDKSENPLSVYHRFIWFPGDNRFVISVLSPG
jgi:hypothetical protein